MQPYYERNGITIYHADCRELITDFYAKYENGFQFNLLLTDPPYGIDGGRGGDSKRGKGKYETNGWQDTEEYIVHAVVPTIYKYLQMSERAIITPGTRHMHRYPMPVDAGCFWTPASVSHGPWGFVNFHPVLYYGKDPRAGKGAWPAGLQVTDGPYDKKHPCSKPISAWQWLLAKGSTENTDLIVDPYMGSGTTLRAAKNLGRKAIGVEIEEKYCEFAAKNLEQEVMFL